MVVTRNLNEIPNYVMNEEYTVASDNNKNILPIVVKGTDKDELSKNFSSLPETVNITDKEQFRLDLSLCCIKKPIRKTMTTNIFTI